MISGTKSNIVKAMFRRLVVTTGLVLVGLVGFAVSAIAQELPPGGTFIDDDGSPYEGSIEAILAEGITQGCDARGIRFCPEDSITRGEVAAFLARALNLPASSTNYFTDDNGHIFEGAINRLAEAKITLGCDPPTYTRFCPDRTLSRAEMATLLVRAFPGSVPASGSNAFSDDAGDVHENNINRIAAANITLGCNPPTNSRYCPRQKVNRGQMATFITRAMGLQALKPPAQKPIERVSSFTTFYDCCQNRVTNIRLMARTVDDYVVMPGETF